MSQRTMAAFGFSAFSSSVSHGESKGVLAVPSKHMQRVLPASILAVEVLSI